MLTESTSSMTRSQCFFFHVTFPFFIFLYPSHVLLDYLTGQWGRLPDSTATTSVATMTLIFATVSRVFDPACGVKTTFFKLKNVHREEAPRQKYLSPLQQ